ncbi:hypothetical protein HCDG_00432 [Histoplasma capsulatum H143]|uniref:Uncharacterized protein n=1 Tax=Ajellomyces capsulatus (strain H143) TaxID=544712 RepID=C6H5B1_AJECH|nr:hypothetical protein HCDG_00432 [Histoplasma capsulatum H143]
MWIDQWHVVDIVDVVVVVVVVVVGNGCMVVIHRASARGRQSIKLKKPWFEQLTPRGTFNKTSGTRLATISCLFRCLSGSEYPRRRGVGR